MQRAIDCRQTASRAKRSAACLSLSSSSLAPIRRAPLHIALVDCSAVLYRDPSSHLASSHRSHRSPDASCGHDSRSTSSSLRRRRPQLAVCVASRRVERVASGCERASARVGGAGAGVRSAGATNGREAILLASIPGRMRHIRRRNQLRRRTNRQTNEDRARGRIARRPLIPRPLLLVNQSFILRVVSHTALDSLHSHHLPSPRMRTRRSILKREWGAATSSRRRRRRQRAIEAQR